MGESIQSSQLQPVAQMQVDQSTGHARRHAAGPAPPSPPPQPSPTLNAAVKHASHRAEGTLLPPLPAGPRLDKLFRIPTVTGVRAMHASVPMAAPAAAIPAAALRTVGTCKSISTRK